MLFNEIERNIDIITLDLIEGLDSRMRWIALSQIESQYPNIIGTRFEGHRRVVIKVAFQSLGQQLYGSAPIPVLYNCN